MATDVAIPMEEAERLLGLAKDKITALCEAGKIAFKKTSAEGSQRIRRYPYLRSVQSYLKTLKAERAAAKEAERVAAEEAERARKNRERTRPGPMVPPKGPKGRRAYPVSPLDEVELHDELGILNRQSQAGNSADRQYIYSRFNHLNGKIDKIKTAIDGIPEACNATESVTAFTEQVAKTNDQLIKNHQQSQQSIHALQQRIDHLEGRLDETGRMTERMLKIMQELAKDELEVTGGKSNGPKAKG